ncbi:MAG: ABC transporter substrate-binding protein [gamma proteobacterium symbiont of Taylorina sp.]|nr:ABC transporter substrate-binding protein [gamma proteobacterium symbiont of Taylorina sp.]
MFKLFVIFLCHFIFTQQSFASEKINLQLVWKNQFQFAGYYMAKEKGFYNDLGLEVDIKEYQSGMNNVDDVISGQADFAVGRSSLLLDRLEGKPVVMLAAIFQHAPEILLAKKRDDIKQLSDLEGKRIMLTDDETGLASIHSMMISAGVRSDMFIRQQHSFDVNDLIHDKTDAIIAYMSNEPYTLRQANIDYTIFNPRDFGFDLYSDILFTSQTMLEKHPEIVRKFRQASLQGWEYALQHLDETVDVIINQYNTQNRSKEALRFEGKTIVALVDQKNVPLGNINPKNVGENIQLYRLLGLAKGNQNLDGLIYQTQTEQLTLSNKEQQWLNKNIPVRYVYDPDWAPFEWTNDVDKHAGIIADILKLIKIKSGINLIPIQSKTWAEAIKQAKNRSADMYSGVGITEERKHYMNFSDKNIFSTAYVFVSRQKENYLDGFKALKDKKIAVVGGYTIHGIIKEERPKLPLVLLEGTEEGFKKLLSNEIDVFLVNTVTAKYFTEREEYKSLGLAYKTKYKLDLNIAVRNDWPGEALSIINKSIAAISDMEMSEIYDKWTTTRVTTKIDYSLLYQVAIALILLIFLFVFWNRKLNLMVEVKTQAIETQKEVLEKLLSVFDINVIASKTDTNGVITYASAAFCEISGYTAEELVGNTHAIVNHPDMPKELFKDLWDTISSNKIWSGEIKNRKKNGGFYWVNAVITPETNSNGKITAYSAIRQDITDKKAFETLSDNLEKQVLEKTKTIIASEEKTRLLLTSVGEGVFGVDTNGVIVFANPLCSAQLGYTEEELLGNKAHALFHYSRANGSEYPVQQCWMYKSFTEGKSYRIDDEVLWRKDGTFFPVEYNSTPIIKDEKLVGAVISFNDISKRLATQKERDEALEVISGSINYATHIQHSILPPKNCLETITSQYFIIWEPRDQVGGDMYWCKPWGLGKLLALGDCTGHGVPGAFMTLIANGALDMVTMETMPGDTKALLQRSHQLIQQELNQHLQEGESDDGLELGVCYIHPNKKKMIFSGARFSLFHVVDGIATEIKGDKKGIGYRGIARDITFTVHELELEDSGHFYMTSDGLIDQIGGEKRRSFGKRRFKELLCQVQDLPLAEQREQVLKALMEYQADERRRDDVCMIGFKIGD